MLNLHAHTYRCGHASGTDREYIEAALAAGFKEIGFSDHIPVPWMAVGGELIFDHDRAKSYFDSIRALREEYKDRITIHIGFEVEYMSRHFAETMRILEDYGCEYMLLGQHICRNRQGDIVYSGSPDLPEAYCVDYYVDACLEALATGKFTYLAHPDVVNYKKDPEYQLRKLEQLIDGLVSMDIPGEYNRYGFFEKRNYPDDAFWRLAAEKKLKTVIGLDCHTPDVYTDQETVRQMREKLDAFGLTQIRPQIVYLN